MTNKLKDCPFCGSNKIELSMSVSGHFEKYYKIAYYCKSCNTYGPRVIYKPGTDNRHYAEKELQKEGNPSRMEAEKMWNRRK